MVKLKDVVRNVISGANKQLPDHSTTQSTASTALATEIYTKISCIGPRALGIGGDKQSDFSNQAAELVTDEKFLDELQDKLVILKPMRMRTNLFTEPKKKCATC